MQWIGTKHVAFVPVDRGTFNDFPPPANWQADIEARIYSKQYATGNISLRDYIYTVSYGRADLQGTVKPVVNLARKDVPPDFLASQLEAQLRSEKFDAAALVMLGNPPVGQAAGIFQYWVRFSIAERVGVWAMELTHLLTGYWDLYTNDTANDLNAYDNMDCACGTHPTAYTKLQLGWLDDSAIAVDTAKSARFDLHSIALVQPPPAGRFAAVRIETGGNPLYVEARLMLDRYDGGRASDSWDSSGIGVSGVIVYELAGVENPNPEPGLVDPLIRLRTKPVVALGQTFTSSDGIEVKVTDAIPGGFTVSITNPVGLVAVPDVYGMPAALARNEIHKSGLVAASHPPNGLWVKSQSPVGGMLVKSGSTVTLTLATSGSPP